MFPVTYVKLFAESYQFFKGTQFRLLNKFDLAQLSLFVEKLLPDTAMWAVSSQGMQDHFGAKSADWLAGYVDGQPRF